MHNGCTNTIISDRFETFDQSENADARGADHFRTLLGPFLVHTFHNRLTYLDTRYGRTAS
jgi:hypothetical protein